MRDSNLASSQPGSSLSIQACFPEIKSSTNSSCKSPGDDDASLNIESSDDDVSLKDFISPSVSSDGIHSFSYNTPPTKFNYTLRRQWSSPCMTFHDIQNRGCQIPEPISSSIVFPELQGNDVGMGSYSSLWPRHASANQIPDNDVVLTVRANGTLPSSQIPLSHRGEDLVPGIKTIHDTKLMHNQALELVKQIWSQVLLLDDSRIGELLRTPSRLLFTATELGIVEFITILVQSYPDLIWKVDDGSRSIFHIAVAHRQEKIFNLIHEIGAHKDLIAAYKDGNNTNMLHLAGKLAPADRLEADSGAALQLRRELHWFKEVEKIVQPSYREMKDSKGRTPRALFKEEHKGLVREGEKWMKDTASSCMVVSTLIATVMFAAAFTVPGGNNNDTGRPIFLHSRAFIVFVISDALALFTSATSVLIFLSILTSRYAQEDFFHSLPNRLIIGLATLFVSISMMMIAFGATLFIVLGYGFAWIAIPIAIVACVPVTLFALLQLPLFTDIISHIYRSTIFFRPSTCILF